MKVNQSRISQEFLLLCTSWKRGWWKCLFLLRLQGLIYHLGLSSAAFSAHSHGHILHLMAKAQLSGYSECLHPTSNTQVSLFTVQHNWELQPRWFTADRDFYFVSWKIPVLVIFLRLNASQEERWAVLLGLTASLHILQCCTDIQPLAVFPGPVPLPFSQVCCLHLSLSLSSTVNLAKSSSVLFVAFWGHAQVCHTRFLLTNSERSLNPADDFSCRRPWQRKASAIW